MILILPVNTPTPQTSIWYNSFYLEYEAAETRHFPHSKPVSPSCCCSWHQTCLKYSRNISGVQDIQKKEESLLNYYIIVTYLYTYSQDTYIYPTECFCLRWQSYKPQSDLITTHPNTQVPIFIIPSLQDQLEWVYYIYYRMQVLVMVRVIPLKSRGRSPKI